MISRRLVAAALLALLLTSVLWAPAMVFAASGNPEKFDYYVKALEYLLKGLEKYFDAVVELFKTAIST